MRYMISKFILLAVSIALIASGCGKPGQRLPNGSAATITPGTVTNSPSPSPQVNTLLIQTYYADAKGEKLIAVKQNIQFSNPSEKYLAALNKLKASPNADLVSLFTGFTFLSAEEKQGNLIINVTFPNESRLGSYGEALLLDAIQKTLFQFSELKTIDILVGGKKIESLMGHLELPHPMVRK